MAGFKVSGSMVNNISKVANKSSNLEAKENFKIEYIDIDNIERNEKNFYAITNVDELAEDIKFNGLNHNLVVRKLESGKFRLISGERRYTALTKLVQEGENKFKLAPCKVLELNDTDEEIVLIQANAQGRELTDSEKLKQVQRLKELFEIKKGNGEEVPKKVREFIATNLGMSQSAVGRLEAINNNLIPELKELLESEKLSLSNANEFQALSEESQKSVLEIINKKVSLTKNEAIELKEKMKKVEAEKAETEKQMNEKIKAKEEELNKKLQEELKKIEEGNEESLKENKETIEKLNNDIAKYKTRSEIAVKDLGDIKKNQEDYKKSIEDKLRNELEAEKEKIKSQVEEQNKNEYEKILKELEDKKNKEKELQEQLEKAKANSDTSTLESMKINTEVMIKIKETSKMLKEIDSKMKEANNNKMDIMNDLVNAYDQLQNQMNAFSVHMKKYLELK